MLRRLRHFMINLFMPQDKDTNSNSLHQKVQLNMTNIFKDLIDI